MPTREESISNTTSTCDRCRNLKVKCHPAETQSTTSASVDSSQPPVDHLRTAGAGGSSSSTGNNGTLSPRKEATRGRGVCKRCKKAGVECTFEYEFKKSGRPLGSIKRSTTRERDSTPGRSASPPRSQTAQRPSSATNITQSQSQSNPRLHPHHQSPTTQSLPPQPQGISIGQDPSTAAGPSHYYNLTPTSNPFLSPPPPSHSGPPSAQTQLDHILNPTQSSVFNHAQTTIDNISPHGQGQALSHSQPSLIAQDHQPQGETLVDNPGFDWGSVRESIFGSARTALEGVIPGEYNFANTFSGTNSYPTTGGGGGNMGGGGQQPPWLSGLFSRRHSFDFSIPDAESGAGDASLGGGMGQGISMDGGTRAGSFGAGGGTGGMMSAPTQGMGLGSGAVAGPSGSGFAPNDPSGGNPVPFPTGSNTSALPVPQSDYFSDLGGPVPQVESMGSWSEFCFFFSLFMRHQHALVPLVHKPSFAMDVLNRRDQRDEPFRGLLFSIVSYTICQSPLSMMSKDFSRERLLVLMEKCQRFSRIIHLRHSARPTLVTAASVELDILSSQATNKQELTSALFSDAQRNMYVLRLNAKDIPDGTSAIDIELGRRIFWHLYTTDKTNVMNGGHTLIHHQEGLPPLPLELDDEHLSGVVPSQIHSTTTIPSPHQPFSTKQTYIAGFVTLIKIFKILGECQGRHRTLVNDPESSQDLTTVGRWLERAVERLRGITDTLPNEYKPGLAGGGGVGIVGGMNDEEAIKGIQQANICITALCAEFALLDLRLALRPEEDLRPERETIAKKAYSTLSSIPIEYLASNGEAMRGKVLRTILALFSASSSPQELGDSVWDWWSMYSQVQFVQVIPST